MSFPRAQLKGSEHRSPSASVWMEIGGREQKTISKCLGSKTVWFQILSCGFGGQGRWRCCVSMSCFVFRIWYLMGNYRGRMVISYLSCYRVVLFCHGWHPGTGVGGRVTWDGWVCLHHFPQQLGCGCGKLLWIDMRLTIHFHQMLRYPLNMSFIQNFCQNWTNCTVFFTCLILSSLSLFLADGLTVCSNIFFSKDSSSRIDWPWLASAGRV